MTPSGLPTHPRRNPRCSFRKIGDEGGLVVFPGRSEVKVLNPVGIAVFSLLDGTNDIDALAAAVAGEFDVSAVEARSDVETFVEDLRRDGLLADDTTEIVGERT